jgi:small-conductance mechanosensitive channel
MRDVYRRTHVPFGVAYGSDKELVRKAAGEAVANVPHTLEGDDKRKSQVWLTAFADSSLNFPQRDLHLRSWSPNARPPAQVTG